MASGHLLHASMFLHDLTSMPLYALWFKALQLVFTNAVWCHFASWMLLVVMVALVPLVFKLPSAWLYTTILVAIPFFSVRPYVSLFASLFLVIGAGIVVRKRPPISWALVCACGACFLAAFSRPEYAYGVFLSALALYAAAFLERSQSATRSLLSPLAIGTVFFLSMVFVVTHSDAGRSGVAFAQHYNLRAAQKGLLTGEGPWASSYAYRVFGLQLSNEPGEGYGRHSITEFARANPRLFLQNTLDNLAQPLTLLFLITSQLLVLLPFLRSRLRHLRGAAVYLEMIAFPTIVSVLLVFPDAHYVAIVFPACTLFSVHLMSETWPARLSTLRWPVALAVLSALAFALHGVPFPKGRNPDYRFGLHAAECLQALGQNTRFQTSIVFNPPLIAAGYLPPTSRFIDYRDVPGTWSDFQQWTTSSHPDWIVVNPEFPRHYAVPLASVTQYLEQDTGYVAHTCATIPGTTIYLAPARPH